MSQTTWKAITVHQTIPFQNISVSAEDGTSTIVHTDWQTIDVAQDLPYTPVEVNEKDPSRTDWEAVRVEEELPYTPVEVNEKDPPRTDWEAVLVTEDENAFSTVTVEDLFLNFQSAVASLSQSTVLPTNVATIDTNGKNLTITSGGDAFEIVQLEQQTKLRLTGGSEALASGQQLSCSLQVVGDNGNALTKDFSMSIIEGTLGSSTFMRAVQRDILFSSYGIAHTETIIINLEEEASTSRIGDILISSVPDADSYEWTQGTEGYSTEQFFTVVRDDVPISLTITKGGESVTLEYSSFAPLLPVITAASYDVATKALTLQGTAEEDVYVLSVDNSLGPVLVGADGAWSITVENAEAKEYLLQTEKDGLFSEENASFLLSEHALAVVAGEPFSKPVPSGVTAVPAGMVLTPEGNVEGTLSEDAVLVGESLTHMTVYTFAAVTPEIFSGEEVVITVEGSPVTTIIVDALRSTFIAGDLLVAELEGRTVTAYQWTKGDTVVGSQRHYALTQDDLEETLAVTMFFENVSISKEMIVLIDTTAPTLTFLDAEGSAVTSITAERSLNTLEDIKAMVTAITDEAETTITADWSNVNADVAGTYSATFDAVDRSGNASQKLLEVIVDDNVDPKITVKDAQSDVEVSSVTVERDTLTLEQIKAKVAVSVDEPATLTADWSSVQADVAGTYPVTFAAEGPSGNTSQKTLQVVIEDTVLPVITLKDPDTDAEIGSVTVERDTLSLEQIKAKVAASADEPATITADWSTVQVDVAGTYTVTFTAVDPSNNAQTKDLEIVIVDTTKPAISFFENGVEITERMFVEKGSSLQSVKDRLDIRVDEDTKSIVPDFTNVDTAVVGSYEITVTVTDLSDNSSTAISPT